MERNVFLVFIFAIFGFFILLAVNVPKDEQTVNIEPRASVMAEVETSTNNIIKKHNTSEPEIIKRVEEEVKQAEKIEEQTTIGKEIVYITEVVKVEIPAPIYNPPPSQEILVGEEQVNQNIMEYTLEIISPMSNKGLGREYLSRDGIKDEYNYLEIALIVWENGQAKRDSKVSVVATDDTQNKEFNGTGFIANIYKNGVKLQVPAYSYHYEFKEAGNHSITFYAEGKEITTTIENVGVDERE